MNLSTLLAFGAAFFISAMARAQTPPPDDTALGTVEVDGSGSALPPLPKLAVEPLSSNGSSDHIARLVLRRDLELSGQFDVLDAAKAPDASVPRDAPVRRDAWKGAGAEYLVRAYADDKGGKIEIVAEAYLLASAGRPDGKPDLRATVSATPGDVRMGTHRLVDQLLGGLTGRPGGFASRLTYTTRSGKWRRAFVIDSDGFEVHPESPADATVISPTFGPGGQLYYALSTNYSPFRVAFGPKGTPLPLAMPGSVMGVAFSPDRSKLALTVMSEGRSSLFIGEGTELKETKVALLANHPAFGPLGKMAYVAGSPIQRVHVDGKPVSPAGFTTAAPSFCDAPDGLFVFYSVVVHGGEDIVASDARGGGLKRLTQRRGANTYPACSPDGRVVAFFATQGKEGKGLYLMPIARPWLAKKISDEYGESLQWARVIP